ncbi:MAG: elongation factor G [Desulfuromonadales bacterium]
MGKYETAKLRNLGIVAHGGAGKTSLTEAILFNTGMVKALGRVDEGSSNMDFDPEEIRRGITITSSLHHCEWQKHSLHIVDTPGYANFLHETRNCLRILGGSVVIVSAISGVKPQTQQIWKWAEEFEIPRIAFVNKMDRERADFLKAVDDMEKKLSSRAVVVTMPIGAAEEFKGLIDLPSMKARLYNFDQMGTYEEVEIPEDYRDEARRLRTRLLDAVCDADDGLLEKYLEEDDLSREEILQGLREGALTGTFTPVLCGSALSNLGVRQLLDYIVNCLPSPLEKGTQIGTNPGTGEAEQREPDEAAPFSAMVFKTVNDPFTGKLSLFRVYSGTLRPDNTVYNPNRDATERIGHIYEMEGKKHRELDEAVAGDIVAVPKLKSTASGDTLCASDNPIIYENPMPLQPVISFALEAKGKNDEDKIHTALQKLVEEDPMLQVSRGEDTKELILSGMGQVHVEVAVEKLKRKYNVEVELKDPRVPYRETIRRTVKVQGKYKKQTGGRGQYGDVWLEVGPLGRGEGFSFVDKVVGGVVPRQYISAVEKGVVEAMDKGILGGFPVVDCEAILFDGSHHSVDSSEMAFKIAGSMAFKKALEESEPVLLEPVMNMEITVPEDCIGDVIGDMNSRRGKVLGVEPQANSQVVKVQVPMAEVLKYAPELRSMTSDRGLFTMGYSHYEDVPTHMTKRILDGLEKKAS